MHRWNSSAFTISSSYKPDTEVDIFYDSRHALDEVTLTCIKSGRILSNTLLYAVKKLNYPDIINFFTQNVLNEPHCQKTQFRVCPPREDSEPGDDSNEWL